MKERPIRKEAAALGALGEDHVVAALTRSLKLGSDVRIGAGDDCAVIGATTAKRWQLLKTDVVIEGVHFLPEEDLRRVGWKALCRAISDIAAMGGEPRHALITLAISPQRTLGSVKALYAGLRKAATRFGVSIVGGETARSPGPMFLSVALTGEVERDRCVLRSGGRVGDALFVTGRLGGSLAGRHLDFTPRLAEARWLTEHFRIRAMMDLSDGLAADLPRLAVASRCGYELSREALPLTPGCTADDALTHGEDYELLFTTGRRDAERLLREWRVRFPRVSLTQIGALVHAKWKKPPNQPRGFDHFAQS